MAKKGTECAVEGLASDMPADLTERLVESGRAVKSLLGRVYSRLAGQEDGAGLAKGMSEFLDTIEANLFRYHREHMRDHVDGLRGLQRSLNDLSFEGRRLARSMIDRFDERVKYPGQAIEMEVARRQAEGDLNADARAVLNEMTFLYMTRGEAGNEFGRHLGEDLMAASDAVRHKFSEVGQLLSNLGLISPESVAKFHHRYLPQLWEGEQRPDIVAVKEFLGLEVTERDRAQAAKKSGIGGSSAVPFEEQRVSSTSPAAKGRQKRRSFSIVSQAEYDAIPVADRDGYTIPYRAALEFGIQADVRKLAAKGMAQETRLVTVESILRHLGDESKKLSKRFTSAKEAADAGYSPLLVSGLAFGQHLRKGLDAYLDTPAWKQLKKFSLVDDGDGGVGEGSGNLYVYTPIANEMNEFLRMASGVKNWADKWMVPAFRAWKESKTIWNAPTHGRNIFGNIVFAAMSDRYTVMTPGSIGLGNLLGVKQQNIFSALARTISETGGKLESSKYYAEAVKAGAISPEHVSLKDFVAYDESTGFSGWKDVVDAIREKAPVLEAAANKVGRGRESLIRAYNWEDQAFRLAIYEDHRRPVSEGGLGLDVAAAAAAVDKILPNYEKLPLAAKKANRYGIPFFGFFAESGRIMSGHVGRAIRSPFDAASGRKSGQQAAADALPAMKAAIYVAAIGAIQEAALAQSGYTDEEIELINRNTRGFNVFAPNPFSGDKRPLMLNLTYAIPFASEVYPMSEDPAMLPYDDSRGGVLGAAEDVVSLGAELATSNPFLRQTMDILRNQQFFTGQEIWKDTDSQMERWMNIAKYAWLQNVPSSIAGYQMLKMIQAMRGMENLSKTGPKYTVPQQLIGLTGLQYQVPEMADVIASENIRFRSRMRGLQGDMVRVQRQVAKKAITPAEGQKLTRKIKEKIAALSREQQRLRG